MRRKENEEGLGQNAGAFSKWAKEERPRRWKENQELWRPGARSRVVRRERSPGAGVRPGERMGTTALGLAARGRSPRSSGDGSAAARFWYTRETLPKMGEGFLAVHEHWLPVCYCGGWEHLSSWHLRVPWPGGDEVEGLTLTQLGHGVSQARSDH